jgi:hypothetical protein
LRKSHLSPRGCGKLAALAWGGFWCGGGFWTATGQKRTEFGDLAFNVPFLFLESKDSGGEDFGCEFCRHGVSSESNSVPLIQQGNANWNNHLDKYLLRGAIMLVSFFQWELLALAGC